ncbi:pyridoxal phosphate-dependent aminotransferase [Phytomonospora sp. NPDC050363]|uniref:pyridoxal phosphate-dependent aminotransferase n=1 Tax=Phytomonospora sp. NPDC050363 TaxID=3155642 RepID=UPI0033FCE2AD
MTGDSNPRIASRATAIPYGLGKSLRATAGPDSIDLAIGLPGYPEPPARLIDAAVERLRAGDHQYEETCGSLPARTALAAEFAVPTDPGTELTVTNGGTEALTVALLTFVEPGDEVVVFEPFYTNFLSAIALAGGVPRFVRIRPPGWGFDPAELAAAFNDKTRAVIVNTPHNPTGHVFTREEFTAVGKLCLRWNVPLISDEVYTRYVFDGTMVSATEFAELADRCVTIGSLSKSHAISGWRLGYFRAPEALTTAIRRVHEAVTGGTATPLQNALAHTAADLADPDRGRLMRKLRDESVGAFESLGLTCFTPAGGCYFLAEVPGSGREYADRLFARTGVIVAPGELFYDDPTGVSQIRVAYNKTPATIAEACARLAGLRG